jgi:hypothetical protein
MVKSFVSQIGLTTAHIVDIERIHGNEESMLDIFSSDSQEAVVSCLSLHWVNDLPGQRDRYYAKMSFSIE